MKKIQQFLALYLKTLACILLFFTYFVESVNTQQDCGTSSSVSEIIDCNQANLPCDNSKPIKYIKINVHYLLTPDGKHNFTETKSNRSGDLMNGYERADYLIHDANWMMDNLQPYGFNPSLPVCQVPVRFVLSGVYFHRTSNWDINYNWSQYATFLNSLQVNPNEELNFFFHYDHTQINQSTGGLNHGGIHQGSHSSIWNDWDLNATNYGSRTICHEVFHSALSHPFQGDNCDDTNTQSSWCGTDNNVMSYTCHYWWNLTPCQICNLSAIFSTGYYARFVAGQGDCPIVNAFFDVPSEICAGLTTNEIGIQASASFNEDNYLLEIDRIDGPGGNPIPGTHFSQWYWNQKAGYILLHQRTGYNFQTDRLYRIKLGVSNSCGQYHEMTKETKIKSCTVDPESCCISQLLLSPNPSSIEINISYTLNADQNISIFVFDAYTGNLVDNPYYNFAQNEGSQQITYPLNEIPNGLYWLQLNTSLGGIQHLLFSVSH
ncbi:MAG: hypothetical protein JNL65_04775 [Saprospiraceae bacterium]|nr:hypothetical protein [Saprospiraceae bacterium]